MLSKHTHTHTHQKYKYVFSRFNSSKNQHNICEVIHSPPAPLSLSLSLPILVRPIVVSVVSLPLFCARENISAGLTSSLADRQPASQPGSLPLNKSEQKNYERCLFVLFVCVSFHLFICLPTKRERERKKPTSTTTNRLICLDSNYNCKYVLYCWRYCLNLPL